MANKAEHSKQASVTSQSDPKRNTQPGAQQKFRVLLFLEELRRRKVCRAMTMYAIGLWLVSQVVELTYQELGLPDWTLRFVIIMGIAGLPIALLLSWLLDFTPEGVILDGGRSATWRTASREKEGHIMDCGLLLVALLVITSVAFSSLGRTLGVASADVARLKRVAIAQFKAGPDEDAIALSESLRVELQHELASRGHIRVVVSRQPFDDTDSVTLTGSVVANEEKFRLTAALIDNKSMEVIWSGAIARNRSDALAASAEIARDVIAAIRVLDGNADWITATQPHDEQVPSIVPAWFMRTPEE